MKNENEKSPRWIPISQGFIWLFVVFLIYSFLGFNLITFLLALIPLALGLRSLKTGFFGSDSYINKMVSSIPNKYLKILESDNLNIDQVLINLEYLEEAEKNLLHPKEILMGTTPIVIRIAYNLLFDSSFFVPGFLTDNPKQFFWYIAAYPDVIDFFYPMLTRDQPFEEYKEEDIDDIEERASKKMDLFEEYFNKKYNLLDGESTDLKPVDSIHDFLIELKNYYKTVLHKKYALEK